MELKFPNTNKNTNRLTILNWSYDANNTIAKFANVINTDPIKIGSLLPYLPKTKDAVNVYNTIFSTEIKNESPFEVFSLYAD